MRAQIDVLREVFEEWLRVHNFDHGYWIYSQDEWLARGEKVITDAELVIVLENQLGDIIRFTGPWEIEDELQDLASGFGYYFEFGDYWNIGFYPRSDWSRLPPEDASYSEKLADQRWKSKRIRILRRSADRCEDCGCASRYFEVHHCYYRFGRYPWQYPDATLLALCRRCHMARAKIELEWRTFMPRLTIRELGELKRTLDKSI